MPNKSYFSNHKRKKFNFSEFEFSGKEHVKVVLIAQQIF